MSREEGYRCSECLFHHKYGCEREIKGEDRINPFTEEQESSKTGEIRDRSPNRKGTCIYYKKR